MSSAYRVSVWCLTTLINKLTLIYFHLFHTFLVNATFNVKLKSFVAKNVFFSHLWRFFFIVISYPLVSLIVVVF